jgi:hypothetical protein
VLRKHPSLAPTIPQLDDLITRAEKVWVEVAAGGDDVAAETAQKEVDAMKSELLGPNPTILERVMVSSVVVSFLAHQRAVIVAAKSAPTLAISAARDRRTESAQRQLQRAIKGLALLRGKLAKGISPRENLRLLSWSRRDKGNRLDRPDIVDASVMNCQHRISRM